MKVVVAVITDHRRRILITRRSQIVSHGGFWEFPGGKLEVNETSASALIREVKEEIGLEVIQYVFIGNISTSEKIKQ